MGLATAVCLADRGLRVVGIDIDEKKVRAIGDGSPPFEERNVTAILRKTLRNGALTLASDYEGIADTDVSFVTVGTPSGPSGEIDLRYVEAASKAIGGKLKAKDGYHLVVVKSTVIPGTTSGRVVPILEKESGKKAGKEFGVAVNPEFLREGSAVKDTRRPGGLVLGVEDERSKKVLLDVYARFYRGLPKTIVTTRASAELIKYSINISRAAQLSLVNSLADICSRVPGGEMADVAKGLALLARMDARYLGAGIGYGGSCLPKDTRAIAHFADSLSTRSSRKPFDGQLFDWNENCRVVDPLVYTLSRAFRAPRHRSSAIR